jgi:hypothetical protein
MHSFSKAVLLITVTGCAVTGCARSVSTPEQIPEPARQPVSGVITKAPVPVVMGRWTITPATSPRRYRSTTTTTIELKTDTGSIQDIVTRQSEFTLLTATSSGSTSFLGSINRIFTSAGVRIGRADDNTVFPVSFTGHIKDGSVIIDELNGSSLSNGLNCASPTASALQVVQPSIIILPAEIVSGTTWQDSVSSLSCNGLTPITTTTISSYKAAGESELQGQKALLLERTEISRSAGEGADNQHRILIKGTSTGMTKIYIDPVTGSLLDLEGERRSDIIITAGRSQRFSQVVKEKTTAER